MIYTDRIPATCPGPLQIGLCNGPGQVASARPSQARVDSREARPVQKCMRLMSYYFFSSYRFGVEFSPLIRLRYWADNYNYNYKITIDVSLEKFIWEIFNVKVSHWSFHSKQVARENFGLLVWSSTGWFISFFTHSFIQSFNQASPYLCHDVGVGGGFTR